MQLNLYFNCSQTLTTTLSLVHWEHKKVCTIHFVHPVSTRASQFTLFTSSRVSGSAPFTDSPARRLALVQPLFYSFQAQRGDVSWLPISVTAHVSTHSSAPAAPCKTSTSIVVWLVIDPIQDTSRCRGHFMLLIVGRRSPCTDILFRQDDSSANPNLIDVHIF